MARTLLGVIKRTGALHDTDDVIQLFKAAGLDINKDLIPLDIRDMTTQAAVDKVQQAIEEMEG